MIKKENKIFRKMFIVTEYAALTNMYAGPVKVYQTCMLVGTSLQNDMTAG